MLESMGQLALTQQMVLWAHGNRLSYFVSCEHESVNIRQDHWFIGTCEWPSEIDQISKSLKKAWLGKGRRNIEGGKNPFQFLLNALYSEIRFYCFEINIISESDHMTHIQESRRRIKTVHYIPFNLIIFLTQDNGQCLYLSQQLCRQMHQDAKANSICQSLSQ